MDEKTFYQLRELNERTNRNYQLIGQLLDDIEKLQSIVKNIPKSDKKYGLVRRSLDLEIESISKTIGLLLKETGEMFRVFREVWYKNETKQL